MALWEWAFMNISTRCFGIHHLPDEVAMCPLIDLVNHHSHETKNGYFITPVTLYHKLIEIQNQKNDQQDYD